jgi:hypothetical protein
MDLTDEETTLIDSVRRQSDAKAAAEKYTGKRVRTKIIRGRCCLFVEDATYTDYFGYTWQSAVIALVFRTKVGVASAQSAELVKSANAAASPLIDPQRRSA